MSSTPIRCQSLALALVGALFTFACAQTVRSDREPKPSPTTSSASDDLYAMSPVAFFESQAAGRSIDLEKIDHALLSAAIFHETNRIRAEHDLPALEHSSKLEAAARMHGRDMVEGDFFEHENPKDPAKRTPLDRAKLNGYDPRFIAENLATEFGTQYEPGRSYYRVPGGISYEPDGRPLPAHTYTTFAKHVLDSWMHSPHHRENILSTEPTQLGTAAVLQPMNQETGLATFDCVQAFGSPMPRRAR